MIADLAFLPYFYRAMIKRFVGFALIHFLEQNQKALGVLTFKCLGDFKTL
ncbi:hypothetical protein HPHPH36_1281 [Helicobacter pylori Hp H-36]|nr:hypothetical protein HPHPH36_1281 [Helicobacter pylori Hp H-36]